MARLRYESHRVKIETPFAQPFVDALKSHIPSGYRTWDAHSKVWTVFQPYVGEARRITHVYFPDVDEQNRSEFDAEQERQKAHRDRAENARRQQATWDRERFEGFFRGNFGPSGANGPYTRQDASGRTNPSNASPTTRDAFSRLCVHPSAPRAVVDAAYRALSRATHPDVNNSPTAHEEMQELNAARDDIYRMKGWQ